MDFLGTPGKCGHFYLPARRHFYFAATCANLNLAFIPGKGVS
jgi:hypothetical protein